MLNSVALEDGILFAFSAYFVNTNPTYFQLWRPINLTSRVFELVEEWPITPASADTREDVSHFNYSSIPQSYFKAINLHSMKLVLPSHFIS